MSENKRTMPTDITPDVGLFDRFASAANIFVSRAWFFTLCVLLVVVWAPSYFLIDNFDTWQLVLTTLTSVAAFLLVALLQNTGTRADAAVQHKLNAIAGALADLMSMLGEDRPELKKDLTQLRAAVGLEDREEVSWPHVPRAGRS